MIDVPDIETDLFNPCRARSSRRRRRVSRLLIQTWRTQACRRARSCRTGAHRYPALRTPRRPGDHEGALH